MAAVVYKFWIFQKKGKAQAGQLIFVVWKVISVLSCVDLERWALGPKVSKL